MSVLRYSEKNKVSTDAVAMAAACFVLFRNV